ncbi:MAG: NADH-quinone oxidoreductase subunit N [Gemmatimonadetes bacterium]|nr:NADH-quinone oxidoreductase subunit N [Gemmatimonadota bacterium]
MNTVLPAINLYAVMPQIFLVSAATVVLIIGLFERFRKGIPYLSLLLLAVSGVVAVNQLGQGPVAFSDTSPMMVMDDFSLVATLVFIAGAVLTVLISISYAEARSIDRGEYYALLIYAVSGMSMMAASTDLFSFFLGLEVLSISLYVLIGFEQRDAGSNEGALKYFLLGAFASGFILYGMALLYGASGSTGYGAIARTLAGERSDAVNLLLLGGLGLLLVGIGFKISMVPFHAWTPDVYQGAPTPVAAFLSTGSKAAAFVVLIRLLVTVFPGLQMEWIPLISVLAVLTIAVGNIVALVQTNLKRLLAYSSIAHAGYMLLPFVSNSQDGSASIIFYLIVYTAMNLGAFGVLAVLSARGAECATLDDLAGLGSRHPLLAAVMAVVMFSLAGIPPTAGFMAKFYLFSAVVTGGYIALAVIGLLFSGVSLYYYLRVVVWMYMRPAAGAPAEAVGRLSFSGMTALCLSALAILAMGVFPSELLQLAERAVVTLP